MMHPFPQAVLRTPLLRFEELAGIRTREALLAFFRQPLMREAIYLASPVLYDELLKEKPDEKLVVSLTKYLQRAATRCTPFALFAGCSAVPFDTADGPAETVFNEKRHTRLDMNYLCALAQHLSELPVIRDRLLYFPNSSIYKVWDKIRYTEYSYSGSNRSYQLTDVESSEYLEAVLERAASGAAITELAAVLISDDIDVEEAAGFIHEIIRSQLLTSELAPAVTGPEYLDQVIAVLEKMDAPEVQDITNRLKSTREKLAAIDLGNTSNSVDPYREIGEELKTFGVSFEWKFLFQTDLFRDTAFRLDQRIAADLWKGIEALGKLSYVYENKDLDDFRAAFSARYEDREVPLTEALDMENGLGYPYSDSRRNDINPMVDGLSPGSAEVRVKKYRWTPVQQLLLKKILEAQRLGEQCISITDKDLENFSFDPRRLPDTLSVLFSVTAYNGHSGKNQLHILQAGNSSAANLLGRFCHGDPAIHALAASITQAEEELNPGLLLAEIVHLPESRIGNVSQRPVLRQYEIPYLAKSGVGEAHVIPLSDLLLSVRQGHLVLRSRKFGKPVLPRLSNAHNYSNRSLPVYRLLGEMQQHYHQPNLAIDLSFFDQEFSFVPRIMYDQVIFTPACWKFGKEEMAALRGNTDEALLAAVASWREKFRLPRFVLLPESDNELFADLENPLSVRCLLDAVRQWQEIRLTEFLFDPAQALLKNADGTYTNQFAIGYRQPERTPSFLQELTFDDGAQKDFPQRKFLPGQEWLYFKIYTGTKTSDKLLAGPLRELVQKLKAENSIRGFFFIRYTDPRDHIRLRFRLADSSDAGKVLQSVRECLQPYCDEGLVDDVQLAAYCREIERYGAGTMALAEAVFDADSHLCLDLLVALDGDSGDEIRWQLALLTADTYLRAFGLSAENYLDFTAFHKKAFEDEFRVKKEQRMQMDKWYRGKRKEIESLLSGQYTAEDERFPLFMRIRQFETQLATIAAGLYAQAPREKISGYLGSYLHMQVNRFFRSKQRMQEMMIYTCLNKYCESQLARQRKGTAVKNEEHV